jgi:hypothetical protein
MLQYHLTTPLADAKQQEAMHLVEELSYLPLAVVHAAACMHASGMTVQQYQAELCKHKKIAHKYSDDSSEGELRVSGMRDTVAATLSLSMSPTHHSNAVAPDYLFIAAYIDRKHISLDLLKATSPEARGDAVKTLDRYSLVTKHHAESALDIQRLVHQALREQLQVQQGQLQEWNQRTITKLLQVFPQQPSE